MQTDTQRHHDTATSEQDHPEEPTDTTEAMDPATDTDSSAASEQSVPDEFRDVDDWVGTAHCDLPPDVVFDVLKNQRRRLVLEYLSDASEPAKLGTLAEHIAAFENGVSPTALNAQQRKRVYIGLYQCHLPKMADAGVIDFNQDRGIVEMSDSGEELLAFLDADDDPSESPRPYLLILGIGGSAFLLSRLLFPPLAGDLVVFGLLAALAVFVTVRKSAD